MERDFKWIAAIISAPCVVCRAEIRQDDFFYFEAVERKQYCRDCGRAIRKNGFEAGVQARKAYSLFRGAWESFR